MAGNWLPTLLPESQIRERDPEQDPEGLVGMACTSCCRWADDDGVISESSFDAIVEDFGVPPEFELLLLAQLHATGVTMSGIGTRVKCLQPVSQPRFKAYTHDLLGEERERTLVARVAEGLKAAATLELDAGLTGFDKRRLSELVESGARAKRELVEHNIRLVAQLARRLRRRAEPFLELDELISEGTVGLMHAVDKFDVERGFRLSTYATWWIRQSMHRAIANQVSHIRIPVHAQEAMGIIRQLESDRPASARRGSDSEVAHATGLPIGVVATLRRAMEPVELIGYTGASERTDRGTDDSSESIVDRLMVLAALDELRERDPIGFQVVVARFGFATGTSQTLQQVGEQLALTRERIRQIQNRALDELRLMLHDYSVAGEGEEAWGDAEAPDQHQRPDG